MEKNQGITQVKWIDRQQQQQQQGSFASYSVAFGLSLPRLPPASIAAVTTTSDPQVSESSTG